MTHKEIYDPAAAAEAADFIRRQARTMPRAAVLTGTGLGDMAKAFEIQTTIAYQDIPHFPIPTMETHRGRLVLGNMAGQPVALLQGRFHLYEGCVPRAVTFPIRAMQALGIKVLILTNAAGGLNLDFAPGQIMIIDDHINLTGTNPLTGPNEDRWGARFPDMTAAYSPHLADLARAAARRLNMTLTRGIYAGLIGPSLETPAEMRYLRAIGADAVGFSTVMETIAAVHAGMQVLGLSVITNVCRPDAPVPADVDQIIAVAQKATPLLTSVITGIIKQLGTQAGSRAS